MTDEEKIREILYHYETAGLIEQNPVRVLTFLSEDVIGIGMGEQGFVSSKKDISDIMMAGVKKDLEASYTLDIRNIVIHMTSDATANLCAAVYVKRIYNGEETVSGFMQSLSFVLREGEWKICCLHASPIMLSEESIESYPLKFADRTLAKLKADLQQDTFELMNKNFSGGIMGIYANEPFALYFANDMLLDMLGYERTEFEQTYGKSVVKMFQFTVEQIKSMKEKIESEEDFFTRDHWKRKDGTWIWVEVCTRRCEDETGNAVLISVVTDVTTLVKLQMETEEQNQTILSSMRYGSKIQRNLLPAEQMFERTFTDYAVKWEPKEMVGGDIYWLKTFEKGSVLAAGDCTGHGIPGALLTMLVVSVLDNVVKEENCEDTAEILYQLDRNMTGVLCGNTKDQSPGITNIKDGCDIAVFYIAKSGEVCISASNMYIFMCDGTKVDRIKGQHFYIGEGMLEGKEKIKTTVVSGGHKNSFYIASDGLSDQIGGERELPFGTGCVKKIMLENYKENQKQIIDKIWTAFEDYQGENIRRDDVEIISFIP